MYDLRVHLGTDCVVSGEPKVWVKLQSAGNHDVSSDEIVLQRGHWRGGKTDEFVVATNKNVGRVSVLTICYSNATADDRIFIKEVKIFAGKKSLF